MLTFDKWRARSYPYDTPQLFPYLTLILHIHASTLIMIMLLILSKFQITPKYAKNSKPLKVNFIFQCINEYTEKPKLKKFNIMYK